jgi:hypothetical protein
MFVVTEADAAVIRAVYEQRGELSAASSCADGFLASPTTDRRGSAPGPSRLEAAAGAEAYAQGGCLGVRRGAGSAA